MGRAHYVYLYRSASDPGRVRYVGYGENLERALADRPDNPAFTGWLERGNHQVEVAGPYGDEDVARQVEASLISAIDPEFNRVAGSGPKFVPLGVPPELKERPTLDPLALSELGRRTGGALLVYLAPGTQLSDGREKYDPAYPADEVIVSNIEGVWDLGRHLDEWRRRPDQGPQVLLGIYGPKPARRFVVAATRIATSRWGSPELEVPDQGRWRVPLADPGDLDACELRGRRVGGVKFSNLAHLLHIWVDGSGRVRHPLRPVDVEPRGDAP
jgi:hypothetical protein